MGKGEKGAESQGRMPVHALSDSAIEFVRASMLAWGNGHYQSFPWRNADEAWHALIAEILLQRTRASSVVPVYLRFCEVFTTPRDLAEAPVSMVEDVIRPLGLRWRAPLLRQLGERLTESSGVIPTTLTELEALPGVGTYAASAWLGFHGGRRAVIVDSNVVRWICRMVDFSFDSETRRSPWLRQLADALTPVHDWKAYNYAVLDFAMQVCKRRPECTSCPFVRSLCRHSTTSPGDPK